MGICDPVKLYMVRLAQETAAQYLKTLTDNDIYGIGGEIEISKGENELSYPMTEKLLKMFNGKPEMIYKEFTQPGYIAKYMENELTLEDVLLIEDELESSRDGSYDKKFKGIVNIKEILLYGYRNHYKEEIKIKGYINSPNLRKEKYLIEFGDQDEKWKGLEKLRKYLGSITNASESEYIITGSGKSILDHFDIKYIKCASIKETKKMIL